MNKKKTIYIYKKKEADRPFILRACVRVYMYVCVFVYVCVRVCVCACVRACVYVLVQVFTSPVL